MSTTEPLHVTFAMEVLGKDVVKRTIWCYWKEGWKWPFELHDYTKDRAYCQELMELNRLERTRADGIDQMSTGFINDPKCFCILDVDPEWTDCEGVLRWAIEAKRAGVDVKVPR